LVYQNKTNDYVGERGEEEISEQEKLELPTQTIEEWEMEVVLEQIISLQIEGSRNISRVCLQAPRRGCGASQRGLGASE
jgi:hypothetical protein